MSSPLATLARTYRTFASHEAHGVSYSYERYALSVAENDDCLRRLLELPEAKRQPNLLLAATRHAVGLPQEGMDFAGHVMKAWDEVLPTMLARSTQTNEPGRCACLLPALARIEGPLALIEVGAAAGLCLLPDRYGYDWGQARLDPPDGVGPVFPCEADPSTPFPSTYPEIAWRVGLDLNPLDVTNMEEMDWLRTLVWPEQVDRLVRLDAAIEVARRDPPCVVAGDLLQKTEALVAEAPRGARCVVFHSAVLSYVDPGMRKAFAELMNDLEVDWLSNEGRRVLPDLVPEDAPEGDPGAFVLSLNGRAIAHTGPHGQFLRWL